MAPHELYPPPRRGSWAKRAALLLATALVAVGGVSAHAQFTAMHSGAEQPVAKDQPVFWQSDSAEYDRENGIVTLAGHVEIWQGVRDLRADKVTYDRGTGVVAASGHVALLEPDGQVMFGDYAELTQGMKDGIISNMRAQLAENGHLAANGARRLDARVNELSRVIYSTCDACKDHPDEPRLWDIRARSAVQDLDNKRIEYRDAVLDIYGVPVMYFPYFTHPDPSQKRSSGFLVPSIGSASRLGPYVQVPYYFVLDDSTDATVAPLLAVKTGPALDTQFRHAFNTGTVTINASIANDYNSPQGDLFANGLFTINDEWRWGFDVQRASSAMYMNDFRMPGNLEVLTSDIYLEGFGQGSYSRLDARAYQGLTGNIVTARVPYVLPRYEYSFVGEPDALGGRSSVDFGAFNVVRGQGTNTQRVSLSTDWERPVNGMFGDMWKFVFHLDSAVYSTRQLDASPSFGPTNVAQTGQAMPTVAVELHWPFQRDAGTWGTQVVEPIVQLIGAPNGSAYGLTGNATARGYLNTLIPNEDSLDYEFTDATLFSLNRFPGIDRLEGGMRANLGVHGDWFFPNGQQIDALVGQGYRSQPDNAFPVGSGLNGTVSDIVGHVTYMPNSWFDVTTRERIDQRTYGVNFADVLATGGPSWLRLNGGFIYSKYNPFLYYDSVPTQVLSPDQRAELTMGFTTSNGPWRLHANVQRDMALNKLVDLSAGGGYENECYIFDFELYQRYTSINGDHGATSLVFQMTFKTVGTFGFSSL